QSPARAARAAAIRSGGMAQALEALRDQRGLPWLADLGRDARYGARMLARQPAFTAVAVLSLALGIGANTAIFTLINTLMLRTLPVRDPQQLVALSTLSVESQNGSELMSLPMFAAMQKQQQVFSSMFAWSEAMETFESGG